MTEKGGESGPDPRQRFGAAALAGRAGSLLGAAFGEGVRRVLRLSAALMAGALTLAILLAGGVYLRLTAGPIDLSGYTPEIVAAVSARMGGGRIVIGGARIALDEAGGGATIVVDDVTLLDENAGPFARIPEATGAFRLWDALRGRVDPSNVTLTGVSGRLVRDEQGRFTFGFGGFEGAETGDGVGPFRRLLAAATSDLSGEDGVAGGVATAAEDERNDEYDGGAAAAASGQLFQFKDASILYVDRMSDRAFRARDADLSFWRAPSGTFGGGSLSLDGGRHGVVTFTMTGRRTESGDVSVRASFKNAAPRDIATQIGALDWMAAFDAPVSGEIDLAIDETGALTALSGAFDGGAGRLALSDETIETVDRTRLSFVFEPESERFVIDEVAIEADRVSLTGAGFVEVNRDGAGAPEDIVAQLDFADIRVAAPEALDAPLAYHEGRVTGRLTLEPLMIEIGELRLGRDRFALGAAGRIWREDDAWRADLTAAAKDLTLADMLAHWPRQAAPGALLWMRENMIDAAITEADAAIRLGGAEEEVKIDFSFTDTSGAYLAPMTPIENGVGSGQVDLERFSLSLDAGSVTPEGGEPITLKGSTFVIEDLNHPDTPATATILAEGRAADVLALLDEEPLGFVTALDAPLGKVEGRAAVRAQTTLPLLKDLLLEDVTAAASAVFTDVAFTAPGAGERVSAKRLEMTADTGAFSLAGDLTIGGLPANVRWDETFSPSKRNIVARTRLTPKRLAALGLNQDVFTGGAIPLRATLAPGDGGARFDISADLGPAEIAVSAIGWRKPEGREAALTAKGAFSGGRFDISAFDLSSADLNVAGSFRTNEAGAPVAADISRLRYRGGVDIALKAELKGKRWVVDARGAKLDFTRFRDLTERAMKDASLDAEPEDAARFRFVLDIDEVRATDAQFFRNVKGVFARSKKRGLWTDLTGDVLGGAPASFRFEKGELTLKAADAGRLMRDAGVFDDGAGGALEITAVMEDGPGLRFTGRAKVDRIVIHEDAKLQQMLDGADLDELRREMRDDGIYFRRIRAPFTFRDGQLRLRDATARGGQIGVNISGVYDVETGGLDFDGVFTPLYKINSALGKIPLLGDILTGGDGQGVFAFTFAVGGDATDPDVSVNPLSVLTPGIFRRIFSGASGDADDASQEVELRRRREVESADK